MQRHMKNLRLIKRRVTGLIQGYRQVTYTHNKHQTVHAYKRELSVCLFSCVEYWRYSELENKS